MYQMVLKRGRRLKRFEIPEKTFQLCFVRRASLKLTSIYKAVLQKYQGHEKMWGRRIKLSKASTFQLAWLVTTGLPVQSIKYGCLLLNIILNSFRAFKENKNGLLKNSHSQFTLEDDADKRETPAATVLAMGFSSSILSYPTKQRLN